MHAPQPNTILNCKSYKTFIHKLHICNLLSLNYELQLFIQVNIIKHPVLLSPLILLLEQWENLSLIKSIEEDMKSMKGYSPLR